MISVLLDITWILFLGPKRTKKNPKGPKRTKMDPKGPKRTKKYHKGPKGIPVLKKDPKISPLLLQMVPYSQLRWLLNDSLWSSSVG